MKVRNIVVGQDYARKRYKHGAPERVQIVKAGVYGESWAGRGLVRSKYPTYARIRRVCCGALEREEIIPCNEITMLWQEWAEIENMRWEQRYIEPKAEWHDVKRETVVQGLWATHTHPEDTVADYEKMSMAAQRAGAPVPEIATIYSRYRVRG